MISLKAVTQIQLISKNITLLRNEALKLPFWGISRLFSDLKDEEPKKIEPKKTYILKEFFDEEANFGKKELRPLFRPGRSWSEDELRLKSNLDLHKLWYVLLKEKNMLLTMLYAYKVRNRFFPNPERLDRINESMENLEKVVHERNNAYLLLETGEGASPPERTITSFLGFTYKVPAKEHYEPAEACSKEAKQYEVPMLDYDADLMQRLYKEKQFIQKELDDYDKYFNLMKTPDHYRYRRSLRKSFQRIDQMPKAVVEENEKKKQAVV